MLGSVLLLHSACCGRVAARLGLPLLIMSAAAWRCAVQWDLNRVRGVARGVVERSSGAVHWLDEGTEHPHRCVSLTLKLHSCAGPAAACLPAPGCFAC